MSIKKLLGLEGEEIFDRDIIAKIKEAKKKGEEFVEFLKKDGSKVQIKLTSILFDHVTRLGE
ncbi:hypothetical protein KY331_00730 [Candidatus Woesearchaeota archaeon]|nr:hypothetical protein [Candidatus Woesearchaeota archaeon]